MQNNDVSIPQVDALQHLKNAKQVATKVATESGEAIQIMDERDSEAIVAELTGGYLEREFIYNIEYEGKGGVKQRALGLSVHAVDEICRVMGGIHTEVSVPKLITEEFIHPVTGEKKVEQFYECKATTIDIITGNSISIYYHEPIWKKRTVKGGGSGGVYKNEYAFQIAQSKARRNSRLAHIPKEAVRRWITEYMRAFSKDKKKQGVLRQSFEKKFLPKDARNRDVQLDEMNSNRGFVAPKRVAIPTAQPPEMVFTEEELRAEIVPAPKPAPTPAKKSATATKKKSEAKPKEEPVAPKKEKKESEGPSVVERIRDALISLGIEDSKDRKAYMEKKFSATPDNIKSNPNLLENALVVLETEVKANKDNLRKKFFAVGTEAFGDSEEAKKIFKEKYELDSYNDATTEQVVEFIEEMEGVIKLNESEGDNEESEGGEDSEEEASPFDEDIDEDGF